MTTPAEPVRSSPHAQRPSAGADPTALWQAVVDARAALADQRRLNKRNNCVVARADLLAALEAYEECLTSRGRPVPRPLREELRVLRASSPTATWDRVRRAHRP